MKSTSGYCFPVMWFACVKVGTTIELKQPYHITLSPKLVGN